MKLYKKIFLASAVAASLGTAFAAEKTLKIGIEGAYPPFSEVNKSGELTGFDVDIAKAVCAQMQRKCDMVQLDWDGLIPALKGRKIDAIIASMSATPERKKSIDFTDRYYRIPVKLVRKKGADVDFTEASMKGKVIGVQTATTFDKHMTDLFGKVADIKRYASNDEALLDLVAGRVDVVAAESLVLQEGFLKKEKGKGFEFFGPDLIDEKYYGEGIAIGIRQKQDKLKKSLNKAIKEIRKNGAYKKINDSYFDIDVYGDVPSAKTVVSTAYKGRKLKIGIEGAYPPFSEVNKRGELVGFDVDIAKLVCAELQADCKMVQLDWDGLIPALKGRKIDGIIASMSATPERKKSIDFTDRYYRIPVKLVRKKGAKVDFNEAAMKGKTLGVQTATTFDKHMTDLFGKVANIKRYASNDEALLDLMAGRVDAVAAESLVLQEGFLKKEKGKNFEFFGPDLIDEKYYGEGIAIGIRQKQDKLKEAMNQAIKAIRENGKYNAANDKYFDIDVYGE